MLTAFYPIPDKYFTGYKVIRPFHAKVKYRVISGKVMISEIAVSPLCTEYIDGIRSLRNDIQLWLERKETEKVDNLNPIIAQALSSFKIVDLTKTCPK